MYGRLLEEARCSRVFRVGPTGRPGASQCGFEGEEADHSRTDSSETFGVGRLGARMLHEMAYGGNWVRMGRELCWKGEHEADGEDWWLAEGSRSPCLGQTIGEASPVEIRPCGEKGRRRLKSRRGRQWVVLDLPVWDSSGGSSVDWTAHI